MDRCEGKLVFHSVEEFGRNIDAEGSYVIYEQEGKVLLGDVVRLLVKANVPDISVAKVTK